MTTFDDGIIKIYRIENSASKGDKPKEALFYKSSHYFGYENLGVMRYYTALERNQKIESVIRIPDEQIEIMTEDVVEMEDQKYRKIKMIQPTVDDDGIKIVKLSLERWSNEHNLQVKEN